MWVVVARYAVAGPRIAGEEGEKNVIKKITKTSKKSATKMSTENSKQ